MTYSVRSWKSRDVLLSSRYVSAGVKEWWVVESGYYRTYIVGYYGTRSLVISVNNWEIYEPAVLKKPPWR